MGRVFKCGITFYVFWVGGCIGLGSPYNLASWILGVHSWEWSDCEGVTVRGWDAPGPGPALPSYAVANCPTGRFYYLARLRLPGGGAAVSRGRRLHREALDVWRAAVDSGVSGLVDAARGVETVGGLWAVSAAFRWLEYRDILPVRVEPELPGWAGYRGGRPDLMIGPLPVEFVSSRPGAWAFERKLVALAAYALMIERLLGVVVDVGYIVSLSEGRAFAACIGDDARLEALRLSSIVESLQGHDPGIPESPSSCPETCPYRRLCWGGGVEAPRGEARVESGAEAGSG